MKTLIWISLLLTLSGCTANSTEIVQYREVAVSPILGAEIRDIDYPAPLDVTGNSISFY